MNNKYKKLERVPYIPNYKKFGLSPHPIDFGQGDTQSSLIISESSEDNPRVREVDSFSKNVPYADVSEINNTSPYMTLPNIGNKERTWVGVDSTVIDDVGLEESVDEYQDVGDDVEFIEDKAPPSQIGEYVLIFQGEIISTGSLDEVQKEVRDLIFGEHHLCEAISVNVEDLIVLKRVPIKVGVFIGL